LGTTRVTFSACISSIWVSEMPCCKVHRNFVFPLSLSASLRTCLQRSLQVVLLVIYHLKEISQLQQNYIDGNA
jgi:hypothetical protein